MTIVRLAHWVLPAQLVARRWRSIGQWKIADFNEDG
jgi:hypothetical protein